MTVNYSAATKEILRWYWEFGRQRKDRFALPVGTWLDRLRQTDGALASAEASQRSEKACMAVWGPSQTGKSTLISSYVDAGADNLGHGSSLHWPGGEAARFVTGDPSADAVVLNPFHFGSDASGCVSRFVLRTEVADAMHPVEVRLATAGQVMHALALGYLSECVVQDAEGQKVYFTPETFRELLGNVGEGKKASGAQRAAYDALHDFAGLLEVLISSELPRYENLRSAWPALRREILECPALGADAARVQVFAAQVLWDGNEVLTNLFRKFAELRASLVQRWGDKPTYCSLKAAAAFLDIGACQQLRSAALSVASAADLKFSQLALGLSCEVKADCVRIGDHFSQKLAENLEGFALLQGLIWELVIPLRQEVLKKNAPAFCQFLEAADLLDFPGVGLAHQNLAQVCLNLNAPLSADNQIELYTKVVKRGKTASIVMGYAQSLAIDSFSVLTRMGIFPAQPGQLATGITTWWKYIDPGFDVRSTRRASPLPFNLVLTFWSKLVNQVAEGGIKGGLEPAFQMLEKLGTLSHPSVLTETFATTYPQFTEGQVAADKVNRETALQEIEQDPSFRKQFRSPISQGSFRAMAENGGTDYLFQQLSVQAGGSQRRQLVEQLRQKHHQNLVELVGEARPDDGGYLAQRKKDIGEWKHALEARLARSDDDAGVTTISFHLRQLLNVEADLLDPLPLHLDKAAAKARVTVAFLEKQFELWRASKAATAARLDGIAQCGLRDAAQMSRSLHYLVESLFMDELGMWLMQRFGDVGQRQDALLNRRFLAVKMANLLMGGNHAPSRRHRGGDQVLEQLRTYSEAENAFHHRPEDSPHYLAVVRPFLERLDGILSLTPAGTRPAQPGDGELIEIVSRYPELLCKWTP